MGCRGAAETLSGRGFGTCSGLLDRLTGRWNEDRVSKVKSLFGGDWGKGLQFHRVQHAGPVPRHTLEVSFVPGRTRTAYQHPRPGPGVQDCFGSESTQAIGCSLA
jgi:hypothetical protein